MHSDLLPLLACPACGAAPLESPHAQLHCPSCKASFPSVGGLPWLLPQPAAALSEWRQRLDVLLQHLNAEAVRVRSELDAGASLRSSTRTRLKLLANAFQDQARRLQAILAPLNVQQPMPLDAHLALRTRLPLTQGLTSYYSNLHRDWAWGDEENAAGCAAVVKALGEHAPGKTLILGAGAGRLAYDFHQRVHPDLTCATDINPLLLLVAAKVMRGERIALYEFPIAPKHADANAVLRTLEAPQSTDDRLQLVFADALHAPFAPNAFDTVMTPWFIDIIPEDFAAFAPRLNRLLRTGGLWINTGSIAFAQAEAARCYSLEEVLDIAKDAGFEQTHLEEVATPYMRSPASRHSRVESVVTFAMRKVRDAPLPPPFSALPSWLINTTEPAPLTAAFQSTAVSTRIYAFIMSLIDGRRSIQDIARVLVEQRLMASEDAEATLRGFFIKMYEDARQGRPF